jgi:hypothetical protein
MPLLTYRCLDTGCRVQGFRRCVRGHRSGALRDMQQIHHANPTYAHDDSYWLIDGVYDIPPGMMQQEPGVAPSAPSLRRAKDRCCALHQVTYMAAAVRRGSRQGWNVRLFICRCDAVASSRDAAAAPRGDRAGDDVFGLLRWLVLRRTSPPSGTPSTQTIEGNAT